MLVLYCDVMCSARACARARRRTGEVEEEDDEEEEEEEGDEVKARRGRELRLTGSDCF